MPRRAARRLRCSSARRAGGLLRGRPAVNWSSRAPRTRWSGEFHPTRQPTPGGATSSHRAGQTQAIVSAGASEPRRGDATNERDPIRATPGRRVVSPGTGKAAQGRTRLRAVFADDANYQDVEALLFGPPVQQHPRAIPRGAPAFARNLSASCAGPSPLPAAVRARARPAIPAHVRLSECGSTRCRSRCARSARRSPNWSSTSHPS